MLDIILTEFIKLKRSKTVLLVVITALAPSLANVFTNLTHSMYPIATWKEILFGTGEYLNVIAPSMFCLLAGMVFTRESRDKMTSIMLTYPVSRIKILVAKYVSVIPIVFGVYILSFIFKLWAGSILTEADVGINIILTDLKIGLVMVLLNLALIPLPAAVCLLGKSDIVPSVFGSCILIIMLFFQKLYIPWLIPLSFAQDMGYSEARAWPDLGFDINISICILALSFVIPFVFNILYFNKSEK